MKLSARNQLPGTVVEVVEGAVNGIVKIEVAPRPGHLLVDHERRHRGTRPEGRLEGRRRHQGLQRHRRRRGLIRSYVKGRPRRCSCGAAPCVCGALWVRGAQSRGATARGVCTDGTLAVRCPRATARA